MHVIMKSLIFVIINGNEIGIDFIHKVISKAQIIHDIN